MVLTVMWRHLRAGRDWLEVQKDRFHMRTAVAQSHSNPELTPGAHIAAADPARGAAMPALKSPAGWRLPVAAITVCLAIGVPAGSAFAQPAAQPAAEKAPGVPLPEGFRTHPQAPEIFSMEKPLLTLEQDRALETELTRGRDKAINILRDGIINGKTRPIIEKYAQWRVERMTIPEYRQQIYDLRSQIFNLDIHFASSKPDSPPDGRELYLAEITKHAASLLEGHNFYVRLNAALILAELDLRDEDRKKGTVEVAYTPAAPPLLKLLNDDKQHVALRIVAARGLGRIALLGRLTNELRNDIPLALLTQLQDATTSMWFQLRLAEALGKCDMIDVRNENFSMQRFALIDTLCKVMVDERRHWKVRSEAARSLGRVPMNASVRPEVIAFKIVELGRRMGEAYNKDTSAYYWKDCFLDVYLAFRAVDGRERQIYLGDWRKNRNNPPGLKDKLEANTSIRNAYQAVLPLVQHVIGQPKEQNFGGGRQLVFESLSDTELKSVDDWLKESQPTQQSVAPGVEPFAGLPRPATAVAAGRAE